MKVSTSHSVPTAFNTNGYTTVAGIKASTGYQYLCSRVLQGRIAITSESVQNDTSVTIVLRNVSPNTIAADQNIDIISYFIRSEFVS